MGRKRRRRRPTLRHTRPFLRRLRLRPPSTPKLLPRPQQHRVRRARDNRVIRHPTLLVLFMTFSSPFFSQLYSAATFPTARGRAASTITHSASLFLRDCALRGLFLCALLNASLFSVILSSSESAATASCATAGRRAHGGTRLPRPRPRAPPSSQRRRSTFPTGALQHQPPLPCPWRPPRRRQSSAMQRQKPQSDAGHFCCRANGQE